MTENRSTQPQAVTPAGPHPAPDPALRRLERLVGTWDLKGRTLEANEDNITGRVTIEWLPGGFFLQLRSEMEFMGDKVQSLEVVGYDPSSDTFPAQVFSNMSGEASAYCWDVRDNVVTHWTEGSKYTGTFSENDNILSGGWRPDRAGESDPSSTYDAIMIRVA